MFCCFRKKNLIIPTEFIDEPLNDEIIRRLKNVKRIDFGVNFNCPIMNLPNSVESIMFHGGSFNYSIDNLPNNLKVLFLCSRYNQPLDYLPHGLEILMFQCGSIYSHRLDNLPASLKVLEIPIIYNHEIDCLPDSIEDLRIGVKVASNDENMYIKETISFCNEGDGILFNKRIKKFPANLKKLIIFSDYEFLDELIQKLGNKVVIKK